jgi:hypothetical protein
MSLIAPLSILVFLFLILMAVLFRFSPEQLLPFFKHRNAGLFVGFSLFTVLLVVHLFSAQPWAADVLKVVIGALLGLGVSESSKDKPREASGSGVSADAATFGDYAEVAGRDINKTIERMQNDIAQFKDAVINQYQTIDGRLSSSLGTGAEVDYLVQTIYERGADGIAKAMEEVVMRWSGEGWRLHFFTSDYSGTDGAVLIFCKAAVGRRPRFYYQHGASNGQLKVV